MKAKDYAFQYLQDPTDETLARIAVDFLLEIAAITRKRGVTKDSGFVSVFREQDQKWACFARQVAKGGRNEVREDGFRLLVWKKYPEIFQATWPHLSISEDIKETV